MPVIADPVKVTFPRPPGLSNKGWEILQNGALDLARSLTPVDQGVLRSNWDDSKLTARGLELTNTTPYAGFVDEGTLPGTKYADPKGRRHGMAPRNYSQKIYDQLAGLAGQLMQQFPAVTGGTQRGQDPALRGEMQRLAGEAEFSPEAAMSSQFSKLGAGVGGTKLGDFGSQVSVNAPQVQQAIGHLSGPARQTAYLKYLAGSHKFAK